MISYLSIRNKYWRQLGGVSKDITIEETGFTVPTFRNGGWKYRVELLITIPGNKNVETVQFTSYYGVGSFTSPEKENITIVRGKIGLFKEILKHTVNEKDLTDELILKMSSFTQNKNNIQIYFYPCGKGLSGGTLSFTIK